MYQGLLHTLFSGSFCVTDCTPTKNNQAGPRAGEELPFVFHNFPLPTCTNSTFCLFAIVWRDSSGAQVTFLRPGATWKETFPGTPLC